MFAEPMWTDRHTSDRRRAEGRHGRAGRVKSALTLRTQLRAIRVRLLAGATRKQARNDADDGHVFGRNRLWRARRVAIARRLTGSSGQITRRHEVRVEPERPVAMHHQSRGCISTYDSLFSDAEQQKDPDKTVQLRDFPSTAPTIVNRSRTTIAIQPETFDAGPRATMMPARVSRTTNDLETVVSAHERGFPETFFFGRGIN